jgi:hypothetical protein
MGWRDRFFGKSQASETIETTYAKPYVVRAPRIGFLNLIGSDVQELIEEDRAALERLFAGSTLSLNTVPECNVLFLYCHISPTGEIASSSRGLREIIRDSGAIIAVVASENSVESYIAAARSTGYGTANLVMTLDRRGTKFSSFFQRLFTRMSSRITMPVAWVELAPQIPGASHDDAPETIFACEAGHIAFA